jgi:hypothetical protein
MSQILREYAALKMLQPPHIVILSAAKDLATMSYQLDPSLRSG